MTAAPPRPRIAIDVTPMLPGAENGGIKILTLALLEHLPRLAPEWEFVLLTPEICDQELAAFERDNLKRRCILPRPATARSEPRWRRAARAVASRLPPAATARLIDVYWSLAHRRQRRGIVDEIDANLLFNPFTAPLHGSPTVPAVSTVADLQSVTYPQFFSDEVRYGRSAYLRAAAQGEMMICISEYVRGSVERHLGVARERLTTIPIQLAPRLPAPSSDVIRETLDRLGLLAERYLLYPANFWPHKNHRMLLLAFRQFLERHPDSDLGLVLTGQPGAAMEALAADAGAMGLAPRCRFAGFVADVELAALLRSARCLVFPSLYEGFGMPLLEAMEHDCPVLCGDRTALPEVGGDAVLTFDPRRPDSIADAIERIENDADLRAELVKRGRERRRGFADPSAMASAYLAIFARILRVGDPTASRGAPPP